MELVICIDIGGTKMAGALVDRHGETIDEMRLPTPARSAEEIAAEAVALVQELLSKTERRERVMAVAIGAPGTVDFEKGVVVFAPNLPLRETALKDILESELDLPVFVDNDANLAALGEAVHGAGKSARHMVLLTLGTGVGGGIILNRQVYRGKGGAAGEIGHMILDCSDRNEKLDLEALASGTALVNWTKRELLQGKASSIRKLAGDSIDRLTGEMIAEAARSGDEVARSGFKEMAYWLGIGLANVANIFNPEMIVIGGGLSTSSDLYLDASRRVMLDSAISPNGEECRVVLAELGNKAGLLGAAALGFEELQRHI
ncbi:MAG: ROK family protein [Chloroflexi bacterium]|nr:ROK family protein [Chloroflexota bacterium]